MVIRYRKGKNQPGKVANPARGQLAEQGKWIIPCPHSRLRTGSCETGLAVPSRVSLLISILQAEPTAYLRDSSRVSRRRPFIIGTHYVLYEWSNTRMYILCTIISAALLSCSLSSTNECPRITQKGQWKTWKNNESRPESRTLFFCQREQLQKHATLDKNPYCVYGILKGELVVRTFRKKISNSI